MNLKSLICLQVLDNPWAYKPTVEFLGRKKSPFNRLDSFCAYLLWSHCTVWNVIFLKEGACMICLVAVLNASKLSDALSYEHKLLLRKVPVYAFQDKEQDFLSLVFDIHKWSSFWKYSRTLLCCYWRDLINYVDINRCHCKWGLW